LQRHSVENSGKKKDESEKGEMEKDRNLELKKK
jgi:hypothetical protein